MTELVWRSACDANGGSCIEVHFGQRGVVLLRTNTHPDEIMAFPAQEWSDFVAAVKAGRFDGPQP